MEKYYVNAEAIAVGYNGKAIMENVNLQVNRGEILTLIGPNGAGKSTILRSIIRQLKLLGGCVYLDGKNMAKLSDKALSQTMSVVMTERIRPELMTCFDVVATGRYPYTGRLGILSEQDKDMVRQAMAMVHAEALTDRSFEKISDGQRQRILLARAICQEPEVIILDEPTSFLDVRHKLELLSILKTMVAEKNVAVIMSLHELDLAQRISDRVVCVSEKGVVAQGTPEEIFADNRIAQLYGITKGSFFDAFGSVELEAPQGQPKVFVIGGGGSGIPIYRALQRKGIPFAVGVLSENDLDYPVAKALAAAVISVPPFCAVDDAAIEAAKKIMLTCETVYCPCEAFGPMNEKNRQLRTAAEQQRIVVKKEALTHNE